MSIREEQCNKVCRILDDVLANRTTERDSLIVAVRKAFESLESSEIPNSSDTVSRRAALEKVRTMQTYKLFEDIILVDKAEVQTELMMLPTVQPEVLACGNGELVAQPEPHWILCSKKMPDEHEWLGTKKFGTTISDEVYVTFENEKGERFCQHMKFQNGELSRYDQFRMDTWFKGSKPIAWMPLPKPFEGGTE